MIFLEVLNELARQTGIEGIVPDDTGSTTLLFDGEHEVSFVPDEDGYGVCLQCEICDVSQLDFDACKALLEASFTETDGAAFAIHRALGKLVIWKRHGEFTSYAALEKAVNSFIGQTIIWKARLASGDFTKDADDAPNASNGISDFFLKA